uniref:Uncharacterized protein n=1 Tax=viral metagenome TaxID=1070528 RepID=A0A6C0K5X8_9ZZZZ
MWYIEICEDDTQYSAYEFAGRQLLQKNIESIYYTLQDKCSEDYKVLNNIMEEQIIKIINDMSAKTIELNVYNYGIDNAIILLNRYNNTSKTNKYTNSSSKSLLFVVFYNRFVIEYTKNNYPLPSIIKIQRIWRKMLADRKVIKRETVENDFYYLIEKITPTEKKNETKK